MPNHVINRITFTCDGDRLQQILSEICYDQRDEAEYGPGTLDINKLKPMPESLSIESGTSTTDGVNLYTLHVPHYPSAGSPFLFGFPPSSRRPPS